MADDASAPVVKIPIQPADVVLPLTHSRAFASNLLAGVFLPIIWPFIPEHIRTADYLPAFIGAFYILSNAVFRELTRTRARKFVERLVEDFDLPHADDPPDASRDSINKL